ncbi:hypothetical protein VUR80DRAFT_3495 [Thermomyces stellatus]
MLFIVVRSTLYGANAGRATLPTTDTDGDIRFSRDTRERDGSVRARCDAVRVQSKQIILTRPSTRGAYMRTYSLGLGFGPRRGRVDPRDGSQNPVSMASGSARLGDRASCSWGAPRYRTGRLVGTLPRDSVFLGIASFQPKVSVYCQLHISCVVRYPVLVHLPRRRNRYCA